MGVQRLKSQTTKAGDPFLYCQRWEVEFSVTPEGLSTEFVRKPDMTKIDS